MPKYEAMRGQVVIKETHVDPYFLDINGYFAQIPTEIGQYISSYTNSFDPNTRIWTFQWNFIDADALIEQCIAQDVQQYAEFLESIIKIEVLLKQGWKELNLVGNKLSWLLG